MVTYAESNGLSGSDTAAAIEACRQRQANGVLSDPLGFAEFDSTSWRDDNFRATEVETFTKPKPRGGTRVEVVPDFRTSVALQLVAYQAAARESPAAYESWSAVVPLWIRHALVEGMAVISADVENYFGTLQTAGIKKALRALDVNDEGVETTLRAICAVNAIPDGHGSTRTGLPVSRDDLVWFVAEAALRPVDERLSHEEVVAAHRRWVDDFFVAVPRGDEDRALHALSTALDSEGLRLNSEKTCVVDSLTKYEQLALSRENRIASSLMLAASAGELSTSQQEAFVRLAEGDRLPTPEHARLWKRVYALAQRLRSDVLIGEAFGDLDRYPTAIVPITSYLRSLNWPCGTVVEAANRLADVSVDSEAILLLRSLNEQAPLPTAATLAVRHVAQTAVKTLHPYAQVLAQASLARDHNHHDRARRDLLNLASDSRSPLARRLAIESLWPFPGERALLAELIRRDSSPTVRGLATFTMGDMRGAEDAPLWDILLDEGPGRRVTQPKRTIH